MKANSPKARNFWLILILFGFVGQIAWSIENMYFNLFLFNYIGGTAGDIANMVMLSAIVATLVTIVMGALSDKLNRRKVFLCVGYILWGLSTLCFAFISRENTGLLFPNADAAHVLSLTVAAVIALDCVMTFFGSTANDAAFNSWVTDVTDQSNRGSVEGVLNVFPLLALLVVSGTAGLIVDKLGYPMFFVVLGLSVSLCGVAGCLLMKDSRSGSVSTEKLLPSLIYGFRPSVIGSNRKFYLCMLGLCLFNTATQIFMPYFVIYLNKTLGFDVMTYSMVMAAVILFASVMSIILGKRVDRADKTVMSIISVLLFSAGLLGLFFVRGLVPVMLVSAAMMTGFVLISIVFMSSARDYTPKDKVGMFQGIRLFFYVLLPMIIGPKIGAYLIEHSSVANTYINDYGETVRVPVAGIFAAAAAVALLVLIPVLLLKKAENKKIN